ncbi:MAG: sodium:alanine symporter family protein, partial [Deltaproteobacteria bacterium]|nr:sodium:alanine symporter family protein [Deltaproteobacteria bacterium]
MNLLQIVNSLNDIIWSDVLVYLCLGVGVYFSIATRFLQVRHIKEMLKLLLEGKSSKSGIS